jgi:hypothetical protein
VRLGFLLVLLVLFFGFFDGFAEVVDDGDFGGFEEIFAHGAVAEVAAGGESAVGAGGFVGSDECAIDDETVLSYGGAYFGLLFGAGVLRHRLIGRAGGAALLAADADGVVGLLHGDRAIVGGEIADGAIDGFVNAFADYDDEIGAAGFLNELEACPLHQGFFDFVLGGLVGERVAERGAGVGVDDDADGVGVEDEVGDLGFLFGDGEGERRNYEKKDQGSDALADGHKSLHRDRGGWGEGSIR